MVLYPEVQKDQRWQSNHSNSGGENFQLASEVDSDVKLGNLFQAKDYQKDPPKQKTKKRRGCWTRNHFVQKREHHLQIFNFDGRVPAIVSIFSRYTFCRGLGSRNGD